MSNGNGISNIERLALILLTSPTEMFDGNVAVGNWLIVDYLSKVTSFCTASFSHVTALALVICLVDGAASSQSR